MHALHDLRYSCRILRKNRTFTATALVVLALGIGATTTIYAVVRAIALRPLPYARSERLMFVGETSPTARREPIAPANFLDLAQQTRTFESIAMHRGGRFILSGRPVPESIAGGNVSGAFFSVLGVQPQRGRTFTPTDEQPGRIRAAMLSHAGWSRLFSSDPAVVGTTITLDDVEHVIVGILPPDFSLWETDIWVAGFDPALLKSRVARNMGAIGRLAEGVSIEQARAELNAIGGRLAVEYPATNAGWTFRTMPLQEAWLGEYRSTSMLLLAGVGLVLLIACANLSNLLLERAIGRVREVSIRGAMGASPGDIVRQILIETLLLSLIGGAAGLLIAYWSLAAVVALIPRNTLTQIPGGGAAFYFDLHTFGALLGISCLTAVLFGVTPALRLARAVDVRSALTETTRGASSGRRVHLWRRALVSGQLALSLILLTAATLMIQSVWRLQSVDRGYDPDNGLRFFLLLPQARYPNPALREAFFENVRDRLAALPGVTRAGGMTLVSARGRPFIVEGHPPASPDATPTASYRVATVDYLGAIGIPLVRGPQFPTSDGRNSPHVAIVNQTLARTAFGKEDPLGRRMQLPGPAEDVWVTVIGVAGDVKEPLDPRFPVSIDPRPTIYRPLSQEPVTGMTFFLRTQPDPLTLADVVRREVAAVDPAIPVMMLQSVRQSLAESMATPRFTATLLAAFASLALLLAAVGVFGVIAYSVNQRTREIGIRMALGASPSRIVRGVVGEALILAFFGVAAGLTGALGAVRGIASQLYGIQPANAVAFALVSATLIVVALTASVVPARRAARLDPLTALRHE